MSALPATHHWQAAPPGTGAHSSWRLHSERCLGSRSPRRRPSRHRGALLAASFSNPTPRRPLAPSAPIGAPMVFGLRWPWGGVRKGDSAAATGAGTSSSQSSKKHLIVFCNGLWGHPSNWDFLARCLTPRLPSALLHVSKVNTRFNTYDGIDVCGGRLAREVQGVVGAHPGLERISFVGHSMGGLLARYALGRLYRSETEKICGLEPAHFVSLASPHCGVRAEGANQLPIVGWVASSFSPLRPVASALESVSGQAAEVILGKTGAHLFLHDGAGGGAGGGEEPLLVRMARDGGEPGVDFVSALRSFKTRTLFANTDGDHLVGWANSSLRHVDELPEIRGRGRVGVVRDDAVDSAGGGSGSPPPSPSGAGGARAGAGARAAGRGGSRNKDARQRDWTDGILAGLQPLGWRRVDVSWKEAGSPYFAHNHIQVTREWLNREGEGAVRYLVDVLCEYEGTGATAAEGGGLGGAGTE